MKTALLDTIIKHWGKLVTMVGRRDQALSRPPEYKALRQILPWWDAAGFSYPSCWIHMFASCPASSRNGRKTVPVSWQDRPDVRHVNWIPGFQPQSPLPLPLETSDTRSHMSLRRYLTLSLGWYEDHWRPLLRACWHVSTRHNVPKGCMPRSYVW
jgi:hypothetical protein